MSWKDEVEELERRRALARAQGGPQAVARQHERGRLTVRERIAALADEESFREVGGAAGESAPGAEGRPVDFTPTNVVVGTARVDGRPVVLGGDDFTIKGGAYTQAALKKGQYADALAIQRRVPLVRLLEGGGASVSGSYQSRGRSGYDLTSPSPMNLAGPRGARERAGRLRRARAVRGLSGGPPRGLPLLADDARDRAGADRRARARRARARREAHEGGARRRAGAPAERRRRQRRPTTRRTRSARSAASSPTCRRTSGSSRPSYPATTRRTGARRSCSRSSRASARRAYKVRRIVELVADAGSFFELAPLYGRSQVTGFARLAGAARRRPRERLRPPGRRHDRRRRAQGPPLRRDLRRLPPPDRELRRRAGLHDRPRRRARRDDPLRHGGALRRAADARAVARRRAAEVVRRGARASTTARAARSSPGRRCRAARCRSRAASRSPSARRSPPPRTRTRAAASSRPRWRPPSPSSRAPRSSASTTSVDPRRTRSALCAWAEDIQGELRGLTGPRSYSMRP